MVIFGHKNLNEMDRRNGTVDEAELMEAVNKIETYLQTVEGMLTRTKKIPFRRRAKIE